MLLVCVEAKKVGSHLYNKKLYNLETAITVEVVDEEQADHRLLSTALLFTFANGEQVQITDPRVISQFQTLFGCDYRDCPEGELIS